MFKSIRSKIIVIYFLLVFIAMAIVGVFMINQFKNLHINTATNTLNRIVDNIIKPQIRYIDFTNYEDLRYEIQKIPVLPGEYELLMIDANTYKVIASTKSDSRLIGKDSLNNLNKGVISNSSENGYMKDEEKVKNIGYRYTNQKNQTIIIYGKAYLENIYEVLNESQKIFLQAIIMALIVTIILGFLVSKSITNPIKDVTIQAAKMAKGDFDQKVDIRSDDEIGQLGEMFNYLTLRLKNTLDEISSEKSKLNAIINQMGDGLIAVDNEGYIIHVNPTFIQMLRINQMYTTRPIYDDIVGKYNKNLTLKYIKDKNISQGSEIIKLENKDILRANFVYLKNDKEEVKGLILVVQDITEHEKLDTMRKEFVANVSHELKTPITTIKSYTETLLDGAMDDKEICGSFLSVIDKESDRMARLVSDLLQLSRMDHKKNNFNSSRFDIDNLIKDIVNKLDISFKEKNHIIKIGLCDKNIIINGDKDRIEQVIQNILSNAIKYTPDNGVVSINIKEEDEQAVISIKDNGIGIPKKDVSRIFERFYRVDKARSRDMGGTGLGLSIAKHIIEQHGGDISVESEVGKGTEFKIKLPVDKSVDI
ncbi:two-component system histidine kinase PnpS [Tepidibacter hydrothermalis]|uniref:histidine kinase n=1 Tax=Tepidibacter hydrothermalis TaxID=3036126 RepID=A0ABY8EBD6_9FIRM|nr:ATP-binding protein [Tepidibacter hydrothermalis]WFD10232.1 ATP-binding protein [Tepidibacter hydrothermalis]